MTNQCLVKEGERWGDRSLQCAEVKQKSRNLESCFMRYCFCITANTSIITIVYHICHCVYMVTVPVRILYLNMFTPWSQGHVCAA